MKSILSWSLLLAAASGAAVSSKANYDGAKVVRVAVGDDAAEVETLMKNLHLSSWAGSATKGSHVDLLVPASQVKAFKRRSKAMDITIMHEDLGASISQEGQYDVYTTGAGPDPSWWKSYHPYADHMTWLKEVQAQFPDNSELFVEGQSYSGRPIQGIHLYGANKGERPAVIFHGTVHAREWISAMTVEYLTYSLVSNYTTDPQVKGFLDNYDFYFLPFINPDGFVYSQTNDRMWRKDRRPNRGSSCVGTDGNRNWDVFWDARGGASSNPCDETYKGDTSEIKSQQNFMQGLAETTGIKLFIDVHSYSQVLLSPYSYTCDKLPPNDDDHGRLAEAFATALREPFNTRYQTGPSCPTLYKTTGSSDDYAYIKAGAEYVFTAELRDTGRYGFVLPPQQILPTGIETWEGIKALLAEM